MAMSPTPRLLRWLLAASLTLNLLGLGLLAGLAAGDGPRGRDGRPAMAHGPLARALSPEDRRAILEGLRSRGDLRPPGREEREAAMAELVAALRADPFDEPRARAAVEDQAARIDRVEGALREALLARLAAMDPPERAALAERIALGEGE